MASFCACKTGIHAIPGINLGSTAEAGVQSFKKTGIVVPRVSVPTRVSVTEGLILNPSVTHLPRYFFGIGGGV